MRSPNRIYPAHPRWFLGLIAVLITMAALPCRADLQYGPAWFDVNAAGSLPDWHYRAPIDIPSGTAANSTIRIDVDFDALLSAMGISGTFDADSPRIVKENGSLVAVQQFTDTVYEGDTDDADNGRGEMRFILEESGPSTCYLYFDITENGTKTPWPAADTINGNFEFAETGDQDIDGWTVDADTGFDAEVRPSENPSVNSDTTGSNTAYVITDGTPRSGQYAFLMGARSQNEPNSASPAVTISRQIDVPAADPGELTVCYRVEGWDSSADGASQYDYVRIRLVGSSTAELVGPDAGNYNLLPYSPNYGTTVVSGSQSGYGRYNGWDTDTGGGRHYTPAMTLAAGSEPWFTVSADLSSFAGQTVTLEITSTHYQDYRSWVHLDDVQWSVAAGTLGSPQAFGADITAPTAAAAGATLSLSAVMDAQPSTVVADIFDDSDAAVAAGIVLYDDGSHGDAAADDGQWTNDGSDTASPTVTVPVATALGVQWKTVLYALDESGSLVSATDGLVHIPGQGSTENQANYSNIDEQAFTIVESAADLSTSTKSVVDLNGGSLYPGDVLRYTITLIESAGVAATGVRITDTILANLSDFTVVSIPAGSVDASTPDGTGAGGSGCLDVTDIDVAAYGSETVVFDVTVDASAPSGISIDNTASVALYGATVASPQAATMTVASAPSSGTKQLYLASDADLSRTPPSTQEYQRINRNSANTWTLTPALATDFRIDDGEDVTVTLLLRSDGYWGNVTLGLELSSSGTTTGTIGTLADQSLFLNGTIQAYTFTFTASGVTDLAAGSALQLTVSNTSSGGGWSNSRVRVYTLSGDDMSQVALATDTVINVDAVALYDAAYPDGESVESASPGETVYVRATVSDPFGSFDISGADVEITGPSTTGSYPMTEVEDSGDATKIYEYALPLPSIGSDGTWTAAVTAAEGTEDTITHQESASLTVGAPLLTILKSASSATAVSGDLITYTVQVVNTGTGAAVNIELDDAMSPYTALRIAYDGSGALPFDLVSAPTGLTMGTPVYSDDDGATYGYGPLVSEGGGAPVGYDADVSHWRLPIDGSLDGSGEGFIMRYQVIVK
jgi:uncharacterized repeat protein (TIGR01451 family)